jgi:hypothetical protein
MLKIPKTKRAGKVTQEVESLPSKHEAKFKSQYNNNNNNNKVKTELGMVEHSCNPITWKKVHEFKANLGYTANSRPAWAIQEDLLSKKKMYIYGYIKKLVKLILIIILLTQCSTYCHFNI